MEDSIPQAAARFAGEVAALPDGLRTLEAKPTIPDRSEALIGMAAEVRRRIVSRELG
jgi:hypothetical protein